MNRKSRNIKATIATTSLFIGCLAIAFAPSVNALDIKWQYSMDSFDDSSGLVPDGGAGVGARTNFEIYGTAVQQIDGQTRFAVQSNLLLGGVSSSDADDGRIHWGDLIINTVCEALNQVNNESLFAIHFESDNESGAPKIGLYGNVELFELASENGNPGRNLAEHSEWVIGKDGNPQVGTLATDYFDANSHVPTLMKSGTYLGSVKVTTDTSTWGLDEFGGLGGETIGLIWDSDLIPTKAEQTVCYHLGPTCNNDIHGGSYDVVPTPTAILPVLSGFFAAAKRKRKFN